MRDRYRLQGLNDDELVVRLPKLAQRDRENTAELLAHMAELDARRLFDAMGFRSMWEYCLVGLGMCRTTAWRRLTAARICRRFPGNFERIASGELQVAAVAELDKYLTDANARELLEACVGKSFNEVELLLAARFPKPDQTDSIRRLPEAKPKARVDATSVPPAPPANELLPMSTVEIEPAVRTNVHPLPAPVQRGRVEPLSQDRFAVRFTADTEFLELLSEVRGLSSHRGSEDLLQVLKLGLQAYQRELLKQRFAVGRTPRKSRRSKRPRETDSTERRQVPADVAREVFERDGGRCTYVSPSGRRCSSRRQLQFDHITPHAKRGGETVANLRLLCQVHNQLAARRYFGSRYMRAVMKRARSQRAAGADAGSIDGSKSRGEGGG